MTVLFEASHRGEPYVGLGDPEDAELTLYPAAGLDLPGAVLAAGSDTEALTRALTAGRPVEVPALDVSFRPPLLPRSPGDALVGGFMATHNVKADSGAPDQPNWFFKGLGDVLKVSGEPLRVPGSAVAVTEEAEVVLVYVGDADGTPRYAGYTFGNDLTDIGRFRRHNGHLSYAKLCDAGIAPWLFLGTPPTHVTGHVTIERDGDAAWQGAFVTGTKALHYPLRDITSRLLSYSSLLHPGRVHYVYLGADRSSFHHGFTMADRDRVTIAFATHGVALTHPVHWG
ncbi:FAH family protein [Streptomyces actuosus]|uniref:FAH family protein n=1 Tax=Streptomyces actuosus TaxID=1885 RepID=A0ABS2VSK9_STRAS|nr:FAH family protein [Streptomyces actuosus]MBN0046119.1 FAH family protein [Streptomyces actuosus]